MPNQTPDAYKTFYEKVYQADHPTQYRGSQTPDWLAYQAANRQRTLRWLRQLSFSPRLVLELGCGSGELADVHPNWVGLEFSFEALDPLPDKRRLLNADMQRLPFLDNSVDFVFSWAAIEHVPAPELVLSEIARVLRPAGIALLAPAWNCRSWTVKRLQIRPYQDLAWEDRINKATIPLRNHLAWRGLASLPGRGWREVRALLGRPLAFDYGRLQPDFNVDAIHISDDDAFASMDPHAAIMYFHSRRWRILSHPTFTSRFLSRHEPVVVVKPEAGQ